MIQFGEWMPDQADFQNPGALEANGVIPKAIGYGPFKNLGNVTLATTARAQGAVSFKDLSGGTHNFCGDATKLYKLNATDGITWDDVSRSSGGAYAAPVSGWWDFSQHANVVLATNGVDVVQAYTLGSSSVFAAVAGSPPVATFTGLVREFSVLARISSNFTRVVWSGYGDPTAWTASATTQSDLQTLADGGTIMGLVGGEYGIVFQERAIQRMTYDGPPLFFRFDKLTSLLGCRAERSIAAHGSLVFFLSDAGPCMIVDGGQPTQIGSNKVNGWLEENIDSSYLYRITACVDPVKEVYMMGFADTGATSGTPNHIFGYHWPTQRCFHAQVGHEMLYTAMTQVGYTLDSLATVNSNIDLITLSLDDRSWTGVGRISAAGFDTSHKMGFFSGANIAATLDTAEHQLFPGQRNLVTGLRPMVQGTNVTPTVAAITRNKENEAITVGADIPVNSFGIVPMRSNARYHRARLKIPAGSVWSTALGVDEIKAVPAGGR